MEKEHDCETCELAVYCFSDESTWVFRTKEEMREKLKRIAACPVRQANLAAQSETPLNSADSSSS